MRNFTSVTLALLMTFSFAWGQNKQRTTRLVTPKQMEGVTYDAKLDQLQRAENMLSARQIAPNDYQKPVTNPNGVNMVSPVELGRASNAFTILRPEQNQVWAADSANFVTFIHRQDVTIWGGGGSANGKYRFDYSVNGGLNWVKDVGELQATYPRQGRYPQVTMYNPDGTNDPADYGVIWNGPNNNFPTPGWIGHNYGYAEMGSIDSTTAPPAITITSTEHYLFEQEPTLLPGGLTQGLPGEFWTVDWSFDGTNIMDTLYVMKGTYNASSTDVDWEIAHRIVLPHDKNFDGAIHAVGPNIAFSPDGNIGWIGFLGDLTEAASPSGQDSAAFAPCFIQSTDGGATWGSPMEMNMNDIPWVYDTLRTLWVDSSGNPASNGVATTAFDFDMVVDKDGLPHMAAVVGTGGDGYSIFGTAKFLGHMWWDGQDFGMDYVAPILTLRGEHGTGSNPITIDNYVQMATNAEGDHVFFSWADSDTLILGIGVTDNTNPNLRIAGKRLTDGYMTCHKLITDGDILWDGRAFNPTLAPQVLTKGNGSNFHFPIVMLDMITGDPGSPCRFWYFGADAVLFEADFIDPQSRTPAWDAGCSIVSTEAPELPESMKLFQSFPNPTNGTATIRFELPVSESVTMDLVNMYGQQVGILAQGNYATGTHEVNVNTSELAAGIYFYNLRAGEKVLTKKMIVTK